jgi:hypothetical protein
MLAVLAFVILGAFIAPAGPPSPNFVCGTLPRTHVKKVFTGARGVPVAVWVIVVDPVTNATRAVKTAVNKNPTASQRG